jgi:hypothetical protein
MGFCHGASSKRTETPLAVAQTGAQSPPDLASDVRILFACGGASMPPIGGYGVTGEGGGYGVTGEGGGYAVTGGVRAWR